MKIRLSLCVLALSICSPVAAQTLTIESKTSITEGKNAGQYDGPNCISANWPPPGNNQCDMTPSTFIGGGASLELHRTGTPNMSKYPGATYTTASSTFFPPTFSTATMQWRKTECKGCGGVAEKYSTPGFQFGSEEKLAQAGAFAGNYQINAFGGSGQYTGTANMTRTYEPNATGIVKLWVKSANGGAPLSGVQVKFESLHQAVGSLTWTTGSDGAVNCTIPGTFNYRVTISGTSGGASITQYISVIQVVASATRVNKFTVNVAVQGTGTPSVVVDPTNPEPDAESEDPSPSDGGSYDGPPGQKSWWVEMLEDAFVPQTSTLEEWSSLWQQMSSWGPWGWVKNWMAAFMGGHPGEPTGNLYFTNPVGGQYNAETGSMVGGAALTIDFRAPGVDPVSGQPVGSPLGTFRAHFRQVLGWAAYALFAFGVFHWLKPRLQV